MVTTSMAGVTGYITRAAWLAVLGGCLACAPPVGSVSWGEGDDAASVPRATNADDAGDTVEGGSTNGEGGSPTQVEGGALGGWTPGLDGGAEGGDAGPPAVATVNAAIGPVPLSPGQETTVCIIPALNNDQPVYIPRISVTLAEGSHHLVVYRSMATAESLTPTPCTAFQGILMGQAVPLMITEKHSDELTFPTGVALKIQAHQMIELEAHYINTTAQSLQGQGTVQFDTVPLTTENVTESDLAFWGTPNIILGSGVQSVGPLFATGLAGTHGFALTTHQHRLGTDFKVWFANSASDTNHAPVADTTDWANPPLYRLSPELDFNGQNGLAYQCTWDNTSGQAVTFGESALQEMCFLWMYYYPTHGFDMRFQ